MSIYNPDLPADYQLSLICPAPISEASHLKVYLDWNPSVTKGTCSSESNVLYSTQCDIKIEYTGNTKRTYLSIFLRKISAQTLITIPATLTNGNQGSKMLDATIGTDALVEFKAKSNEFYINSGTSTGGTSTTTVTTSSTNTVITSSG